LALIGTGRKSSTAFGGKIISRGSDLPTVFIQLSVSIDIFNIKYTLPATASISDQPFQIHFRVKSASEVGIC
jgi:hypothetical protein